MASRYGRRLVIDMCICQSSGGEEATDPMAIKCTEVLENVYNLKYYFVCTPGIREEISRHIKTKEISEHGLDWLSRMASRGMIDLYDDYLVNDDLRGRISIISLDKSKKKAIIKDIHLIEAANKTDNKVISRDNKAFKNFKLIAQHFNEISIIVWMDLSEPGHDVIKWLRSGAKNTKKYMLGFQLSNN